MENKKRKIDWETIGEVVACLGMFGFMFEMYIILSLLF